MRENTTKLREDFIYNKSVSIRENKYANTNKYIVDIMGNTIPPRDLNLVHGVLIYLSYALD